MRFEYDRLDGPRFRAALAEAGMTHKAFARIFGANLRTVERWLKDDKNDIPPWVTVALGLMVMAPDTRSMARRIAAESISLDKLFPERGPYPYSRPGGDGELPRDVEVGDD